MGIEYPAEVLHIQPSAIPAIRKEIGTTLDAVEDLLRQMRRGAVIDQPWLGDPESLATMKYYNDNVMADANGPFAATQKWADQLKATDGALAATQAHYQRTEGDNAALWGRQA